MKKGTEQLPHQLRDIESVKTFINEAVLEQNQAVSITVLHRLLCHSGYFCGRKSKKQIVLQVSHLISKIVETDDHLPKQKGSEGEKNLSKQFSWAKISSATRELYVNGNMAQAECPITQFACCKGKLEKQIEP